MGWIGSIICYFIGVVFGIILGVALNSGNKKFWGGALMDDFKKANMNEVDGMDYNDMQKWCKRAIIAIDSTNEFVDFYCYDHLFQFIKERRRI